MEKGGEETEETGLLDRRGTREEEMREEQRRGERDGCNPYKRQSSKCAQQSHLVPTAEAASSQNLKVRPVQMPEF